MTMTQFENTRVSNISLSPSMVVSMAAQSMRARGEEVVDLSLGEPDFATPEHIVEAASRAMRDGETRYTGPAGSPALRAAVVAKFERENGLRYQADEIAVGNGAKQIIFNAMAATLEPGDEVVVPAPYWVSYTDIVTLQGGVPKVVPTRPEDGFVLSAKQLEEAITDRTRWLFLNSPSNPSGAVYSRQDYQALGEVLERHPRVLVLSDEVYEHICFERASWLSFVTACPQLRERTLLVNAVSKAYAMTGWRLGYAAGPRELIAALNKMQSQASTCPSSISQAAAVAALNGPQTFVEWANERYSSRGEALVSGLEAIKGLRVVAPAGAFYVFPECSAFIGKRMPDGKALATDADLAAYLLESAGVACVPGAAFGLEPYLRFSFAASRSAIENAVDRLGTAFAALR